MPKRTFESIRKSKEKGIAVYLTASFMMVMIPIVGLAIDGGYAFVIRTRLSAAADSAALAAGRGINLANTVALAQAQATTQATAFFNSNFPSGYMNTSTVASTRVITPTFAESTDTGGNLTGVLTITVFAQVQAPTYFMKWLGIPYITVNDIGSATRRNLVLELVLDKSASMGTRDTSVGTPPSSISSTSSSCEAMVYSAIQFLQYFSPYDYLGEISFDATVYDDNNANNDGSYTASPNYWESGSSGMKNSISYIQCGSNTNTTAALYKAYHDIITVNQKLAQNVIILFTDGVPNAVNATFPVRTKVDSRYSPSQAMSPSSLPSTPCATANGFTSAQVNPPGSNPPAPCSGTCIDGGGQVLCTNPMTGFPAGGFSGAAVCPGASGCVSGTASAGGSGTGGMPVCTTTAANVTGVITQTDDFNVNGGSRGGLFPMLSTDSNPTVPSGCPGPGSGQVVSSQTIAYIPNSDYFLNSFVNITNSSGATVASPWFQWIYQVNNQCAPAGTPITSGNSLCKNLGGPWTSYTTTGAGAPNNTFTGGPYSGYLRPDLLNSIGVASMTSATNMAYTIRSDTTYNPVIHTVYLQGNGTDPVDPSFLQIVSNQKTIQPVIYDPTAAVYDNPYYQSNQATGIWAATASTLQLEAMFQEIASSLLRISQ
jgi:Flp pilus assembly protein TadG